MTVVATPWGPVRGEQESSTEVFRGIPFAAPPVGDRRWAPPVAPEPWDEPRAATAFGPAAWQLVGGPLDGLVRGMGSAEQGEDCLTLNVWTPACDDARRPVMVWIHGGAYAIGSGALPVYGGARLAAATDTVVVTVNYRLGAFGFMLVDHPDAAANPGLLDQVAALEWVRDAIAGFGGDPGNVTIFGESAGAGCVLSLLGMPRARGLFHKAIVQSGATDLLLDRERALMVSAAVARAAGLEPGDLDGLRALSPEAVLAAQGAAAGELFATVGMMPFHPCVDGDVLPVDWYGAAGADPAPVPTIIGTTRDEMALFGSFDPSAASMDDDGLRARLATLTADVDAVVAAHRAVEPGIDPPWIWKGAQTATAMWLPALRVAESRAAVAPTWMYRFDWPAANPDMGAPHAVDIPFPFTNVDVDGWDGFLADPTGAADLAATEQQLWASFARTGTPSAPGVDWPSYDAERRATLVLGPAPAVEDDPWSPLRQAWASAAPPAS